MMEDNKIIDLIKSHIEITNKKIDDLSDIITRVAHATERVQMDLTEHKEWEEKYHKSEIDKDIERDKKFNKLVQDLSLYFDAKATGKNIGIFGGWLAKLSAIGLLIAWVWHNWFETLLKKIGL